jgi:hypothetical protein
MNKDEALKLALEALRMADELCRGYGVDFKEYGLEFDKDIQVKYRETITAIKEALAQPVQHREGHWCADLTCSRCYSADFRFKHTTPPLPERQRGMKLLRLLDCWTWRRGSVCSQCRSATSAPAAASALLT